MFDRHSKEAKEAKRLYDRKYRKKNKEIIAAKAKLYEPKYRETRDVYREAHKDDSKKWRSNNRDLLNFNEASRRARKLKATPSWSEKNQIKRLYKLSRALTKTFKEEHHVDHIVPLKNEKVCGLHCIDNLQILTQKENLTKHNKFNGGAPCLDYP